MTTRITDEGYPLSPRQRWLLGFWSLAWVVVLFIASQLTPHPQGYGTHEQLGLPPCTMRLLWGIPCPTCGMTTSFSLLMHGDLSTAFRVNAAGCLLALGGLLHIPWCGWSLWRGRFWMIRQPLEISLILLGTIVGISLLQWSWTLLR